MGSELPKSLDLKKILGDHYDRPWNYPLLVGDQITTEAIRQRGNELWQERLGQTPQTSTNNLQATSSK